MAMASTVTFTFFAACVRIKRATAFTLGWSIAAARVAARWAYIALQAQRQGVDISWWRMVLGAVVAAVVGLAAAPIFRYDLSESSRPAPTRPRSGSVDTAPHQTNGASVLAAVYASATQRSKSMSLKASNTDWHLASAKRAKGIACAALLGLMFIVGIPGARLAHDCLANAASVHFECSLAQYFPLGRAHSLCCLMQSSPCPAVGSGTEVPPVLTFVVLVITLLALRNSAAAHTSLSNATLKVTLAQMAAPPTNHRRSALGASPGSQSSLIRTKTPRVFMSGMASSSDSESSSDSGEV